MPNIDLAGPAKESSWRRLALSAWGRPSEPTVLGLMDVDARALLARIEELRAEGHRVTVTHVVSRAVAIALGRHPETNVAIRFGRAWRRERVDIFVHVMVPADDESGSADLSGVKIKDADQKDLVALAQEIDERVKIVKARQDPELQTTKARMAMVPRFFLSVFFRILNFLVVDLNFNLRALGVAKDPFGSAGVTNVGVFGVDTAFTPLFPLNGPNFFVAVASLKERPVVDENGEVVARPVLRLTGTFDHRVYDGFQVATLAGEIRTLLEKDVALL